MVSSEVSVSLLPVPNEPVSPMPILTLDVFADIACPWCYVGERRLGRALEEVRTQLPEVTVTQRWRPFQLQPNLPPEGVAWRTFARTKFGGWERAEVMFERLEHLARPDGIRFHFDKIQKANNTQDAHRLILFARQHDREWAMVEALFAAYFTQGRDLNSKKDLRTVVHEVGLEEAAAMAFLASDAGKEEVQESQHVANQLGIRGVPYFILNQRHALSGAQPTATFVEAILQVCQEPAASA